MLSELPIWEFIFAFMLVTAIGVTSSYFQLKLSKTIWLATCRSILQLLLLAYILVWLFSWRTPWVVVIAGVFMTLVASWTVRQRMKNRYRGQFRASFLSIFVGILFNSAYMLFLLLPQEPWYRPEKAIPLIGMLLGNSLNGITLGLDKFLSDIKNCSSTIEADLALGASGFEALSGIFRDSLETGITPIINTMMVVGLVSIPGMMTGQVLGGADVMEAAFYQIMIIILILGCTFMSVLLALYLAFMKMIGNAKRLHMEYFDEGH